MRTPESKRPFDVYEVYEGRCPPKEEETIPRAEWVPAAESKERARAIEREILQALLERMKKYTWDEVFRVEGADPTKRSEVREEKIRLQCDPSLELRLSTIYSENAGRHGLAINLYKYDGRSRQPTYVSAFGLERLPDDTLDIFHRMVNPAFRGNHLFSAAMNALKQFVDAMTVTRKHLIRLRFECGQPELVSRILAAGFVPENEKQKERVKKMIIGDASLHLDHSYSLNEKTGEWLREEQKMLYCYETAENPHANKRFQESYRTVLMYEPEPNRQAISAVQSETLGALKKTSNLNQEGL